MLTHLSLCTGIGLGNAVVPQQIYPLFKAIAEYEKGERS